MQDTPIISPDGQSVWNGTEWMPYAPSVEAAAPQPPGTEKPRMNHLGLKITGGVLAVLVAVGIATAEAGEDTGAEAVTHTSGNNAPANESLSTVETLSLPEGCHFAETLAPAPYDRWTAWSTGPIKNASGRNVNNVVLMVEILRDGQVVGIEDLAPSTVPAGSEIAVGVPLDRDWPIDPSTDTCRLTLVSDGNQPATGWIGASAQPEASGPPTYRGLSIGMSIAEAEATGVIAWHPSEGDAYETIPGGWLVPVPNDGSFTFQNSATEITVITVEKTGWSTPEGITVGSSVSEVYAAYSNAVLDDWYDDWSLVLVDNGSWGYAFTTDDGVVTSIGWGHDVDEIYAGS